jgi:predicted nucleic acid-binding Zn ribbon protein
MPTYTFEDTQTGNRFDKFMKMNDREKYLEENPQLKTIIGAPATVSDTGSLLSKTSDHWTDLLKSIKNGSGRNNSIHTK